MKNDTPITITLTRIDLCNLALACTNAWAQSNANKWVILHDTIIAEIVAADEAAKESPATEAEQQPTETENAPQAATQAAKLDTLKALRDDITTDPNPDTIRAALDAIRQQDPETELTEQDSPRAIRAELTEIINGIYWDMAPDITAAIIDSMNAPAPAQTITVNWANGTRATYSANMLDLLRTDPAALDIQDDITGELVYIRP